MTTAAGVNNTYSPAGGSCFSVRALKQHDGRTKSHFNCYEIEPLVGAKPAADLWKWQRSLYVASAASRLQLNVADVIFCYTTETSGVCFHAFKCRGEGMALLYHRISEGLKGLFFLFPNISK